MLSLPKDLSQPGVTITLIPNEQMRKLRGAPWNLVHDPQVQELLHWPLHSALKVGRGRVETWSVGFLLHPSLKIHLEGYEQNVFDLEAKCLPFRDYFIHALIQQMISSVYRRVDTRTDIGHHSDNWCSAWPRRSPILVRIADVWKTLVKFTRVCEIINWCQEVQSALKMHAAHCSKSKVSGRE